MSNGALTKDIDETFRPYAWDYFALHSDQRLKAFHFYILLCTALIGGFALLTRNGGLHKWMAVSGVLLIFFSFVFWKFDERTRALVKNAEAALKHLDSAHNLPDVDGLPHPLRLFSREEANSAQLSMYPLMSGHFTYARSLRWVFTAFAALGAVVIFGCLTLAQP